MDNTNASKKAKAVIAKEKEQMAKRKIAEDKFKAKWKSWSPQERANYAEKNNYPKDMYDSGWFRS